MNYINVMTECADPHIGQLVLDALQELLRQDYELLERDASERSIAARLASYLQRGFPDLDVDVEYNRMGDTPKEVPGNGGPERVYPDIIIHRRGTRTNLLAIELKKSSNPQDKQADILKLRAYRRELDYRHALFLRLGVSQRAGALVECEWVE